MPANTDTSPEPLRCPNCGSDYIDAWWRESVRYSGHVIRDDRGHPEFVYEGDSEIDPNSTGGGDFDCYWCRGCDSEVEFPPAPARS